MTCSLLLSSCRKDTPQQPQTKTEVKWSVDGVAGYSTKALINSADDIAAACTPGTGGQTIGIWADYDITIDGTPYSVENVFNTPGL